MAHLDDRGQILLVGALAIAVAFVALALVLNSSVYVENIANRENVVVGNEGPVVYQDGVRRGVGRAIVAANANASSFADRETQAKSGIAALGSELHEYHAREARVTDLSHASTSEGTRILRPSDGNFTQPNGTAHNWTVAGNVSEGGRTEIRRFGMDVVRSDLESGSRADAFKVVIDDGSDAWTIFVRRNNTGPKTVVETRDPSGTLSAACTDASGSRTEVNVTAATVGGEHCEALDFHEEADAPYTVSFEFAGPNNVSGTYDLVVNTTAGSLGPEYGATSEVETRSVVYSMRVDIVYLSPDVEYETRMRVAPGEPDA